ncbi:MAG TPA: lasso RiPP family leader peptide-containing protein [Thermoanaerobaculia bacterium]|nr:lasso RiPP family leader peptide-containing protein [Thermoanaerobaculia bacterium]
MKNESQQWKPRKPYRRPALTVYGSVRELTREGGPNNQKDGGNNALGNRT